MDIQFITGGQYRPLFDSGAFQRLGQVFMESGKIFQEAAVFFVSCPKLLEKKFKNCQKRVLSNSAKLPSAAGGVGWTTGREAKDVGWRGHCQNHAGKAGLSRRKIRQKNSPMAKDAENKVKCFQQSKLHPFIFGEQTMQKIFLGFLALVFLVILSPVFMFSMLAPRSFSTILTYWSIFVGIATVVLGGLFAYIRADLKE